MKKDRKISWRKIAGLIAMIFVSASIDAQELNTPAAIEFMKEKSLWRQSENAAGLLLDDPIEYSEFEANYSSYQGGFHRPQQGKSGSNLTFFAEGATLLNKIYVWGQFDYAREKMEGVNFKQSIIDPYRGMPYYITDLNESDWENQYYNMQFKVNLPVGQKTRLGLDGKYNVAQGAKQRDIRTTNLSYSLCINPAIVYSPTNAHHIGASLEYNNFKEEADPDMVNTSDYQTYYELYGLGTAVENIGSGKTVNYMGNKIGGALQYAYNKEGIELLLAGNYSYRVEDAEFSFTNPQKYGTAKEKLWGSKMFFQLAKKDYSHHFEVGYNSSNIDGIQYINQNTSSEGWQTLYSNIRSTYKTNIATFNYSLIANRGNEYKWRLGMRINYLKKEDEYLIPRSVKQAENLTFNLSGKVNFALSDKLSQRLLVDAAIGYNNNLSGQYTYEGSNPNYAVVTEFEQTDLNYLVTDFYSLNTTVTYSQKVRESINTNLFVKGAFNYQKAKDFNFGHRSTLQFSLGCNF